uniref:Uncharacterized protein n=1 Tax=Arundo donax TaxID=35708 RepID=A0A0A9FCI6_ARUDO
MTSSTLDTPGCPSIPSSCPRRRDPPSPGCLAVAQGGRPPSKRSTWTT